MTEQELQAIERMFAEAAASPDEDGTARVDAEATGACSAALVAEVRRLRGLLKDAEWADGSQGETSCPWCDADVSEGHRSTCPAFPPEG